MSGFDEEAERERLREKYERDREKRTATQRMSELLLKGATMTNRHCDACGDPIFRHDDQEFCPTCQAVGPPATGDAAAREDEATDASAGDGDATGPEASAGDGDATGVDASAGRDDATSAGRDDASGADAGLAANAAGSDPADGAATDAPAPAPDASRRASPKAVEGRPERGSPAGAAEDPTEVRASLSRTLARYARAAEETDDPRRAKELLGAAREAAETLAALDRR